MNIPYDHIQTYHLTLYRKPNLNLMRSHRNYEYFVQQEMRSPENYTTDKNPLQIDTVTVNNLARGLPLIVTISIKHDKNILEKLITKDQKEGKLQYNWQNL